MQWRFGAFQQVVAPKKTILKMRLFFFKVSTKDVKMISGSVRICPNPVQGNDGIY